MAGKKGKGKKLTPVFNAVKSAGGASGAFLTEKDFENKEKIKREFLAKVKPGLVGLLANKAPEHTDAKRNVIAQLTEFFGEFAQNIKPTDPLQPTLQGLMKTLREPHQYPDDINGDALAEFLEQNLTEDSPLLDIMTDELPDYLAENLNNFERMIYNLSKQSGSIVKTQAQHAAYSQGWEKVGFMLGNIVIAVAEYVIMEKQGKTIPLDLQEGGGSNPNIVPIPMPPVK